MTAFIGRREVIALLGERGCDPAARGVGTASGDAGWSGFCPPPRVAPRWTPSDARDPSEGLGRQVVVEGQNVTLESRLRRGAFTACPDWRR